MYDQQHHAQQRRIAGTMQAEQQRHIGERDAGDADGHDAPRPDLDIGRGFCPNRNDAKRPRQRADDADEPARERIGIDDGEDHEADGCGIADLRAEQCGCDADENEHREQLEQETPEHEGQPQQQLPDTCETVAALVQLGRGRDIGDR
ncbi:hypothetical protein [Bradyrhizobium japonicum]